VATQSDIDGFYVAYISGTAGLGMAMFIFSKGIVVGSDVSGVSYDGTYEPTQGGSSAHIKASVVVPGSTTFVQGGVAPPEGTTFPLDVVVPLKSSEPFFHLETPRGPVNVRLTKLRGLGEGLDGV
jgi:hypothetical protein